MVQEPERKSTIHMPSLLDMGKFAFFSGLTILAAWFATIGRVAYTVVMLVVAAALALAVLDLVGMEIVKKERRRRDSA